MMVLLSVFKVVLPLFYMVVWGVYLWLFYTDDPRARRICSRLAAAAVLLHVGCITAKSMVLGRLAMGGALEFMCAWALALLGTYLVIEKRLKAKNTGFLVTGMAFFLVLVASAFSTTAPKANTLLSDPGFAGHVVLVLLAYTALSLSFLFAVLYLILTRQLMRRQFGLLFRRLPSLATLERMSVGAVELGVPLLFLALALGHLWMYDLADRLPAEMAAKLTPWDPKIMVSWIIFLGYTAGLLGHRFLGWRGRRMNVMAVTAFVVVVAAVGVVHHFFPSFHKFNSTQPVTHVSEAQLQDWLQTCVLEVRP
jgi:HemX protein